MFRVRIPPEKLNRLDAEYFDPLALKAEEMIRSREDCKNLGHLIKEGYRVRYHGRDPLSGSDQGVPFLSPANVEEDEIVPTKYEVRVPSRYLDDYEKGIAYDKELLIEVKGNTKKVAVFLECNFQEDVLISGSFYKASLKEGFDEFYVLAFLKSTYGNVLKRRLVSNINISYISKWELYSIPIPVVAPKAQNYIGDKVRQTENLRLQAKKYRQLADKTFVNSGIYHEEESQLVNRIQPDSIKDRIDPIHYRKDLLDTHLRLNQLRTVRLSDKSHFSEFSDGDHGNPEYGNGPAYIRANEIKNSLWHPSEDSCLTWSYANDIADQCWATEGDVVFSIVGTLGLAACMPQGISAVMSRGIAKVTPKILSPYYVKAFMRSPVFAAELLRFSVGTIQRGVYLHSLASLQVPLLDQAQMEIVAEYERFSDSAFRSSHLLIKAAQYLVEALIEPDINLTEKDLIKAYENPEADRALMERLKVDGFDGEGDPLFPDLGTLADLITKATNPDLAEA